MVGLVFVKGVGERLPRDLDAFDGAGAAFCARCPVGGGVSRMEVDRRVLWREALRLSVWSENLRLVDGAIFEAEVMLRPVI